jgi:hypothetical protein
VSSRPFRDPDGALERAALLERENAELLEQIEKLRSAVAEEKSTGGGSLLSRLFGRRRT